MIGSSKKAATYFSTIVVSSAQTGLTSLFGKVRGEPRRYNHLSFKLLVVCFWLLDELSTNNCQPSTAAKGCKYLNIKEKGIKKINNKKITYVKECLSRPKAGENVVHKHTGY